MSRSYVDTSAIGKLLVAEPESEAVRAWLEGAGDTVVSSDLLETELRRIATTRDLSQETATAILDRIELHELPRSIFRDAGLQPGHALRSLDALHLVSALRLGADVLVTYDARLTEAARGAGIAVVAPA